MLDQHQAAYDVWERHHDENWRREQSHWRGVGRWKDEKRWQRLGETTHANLIRTKQLLNLPVQGDLLTALEWGPGGGTNVFAMRHLCRTYYGIDVSAANLAECTRMISCEGFGHIFRPVILVADPKSFITEIKEPVDLFLSTAVFQHFPSKEYGREVLQSVRRVCKSGAIGIIQIRYDNGNENFLPISDISEYYEKHITANSYKIDEFWDMLCDAGFQPLMINDLNTKINYATFCFLA